MPAVNVDSLLHKSSFVKSSRNSWVRQIFCNILIGVCFCYKLYPWRSRKGAKLFVLSGLNFLGIGVELKKIAESLLQTVQHKRVNFDSNNLRTITRFQLIIIIIYIYSFQKLFLIQLLKTILNTTAKAGQKFCNIFIRDGFYINSRNLMESTWRHT